MILICYNSLNFKIDGDHDEEVTYTYIGRRFGKKYKVLYGTLWYGANKTQRGLCSVAGR